MVDMSKVMTGLQQLNADFTMKIGRKKGTVVVEMQVGDNPPATSMGENLTVVTAQAFAGALQKMAEKILAEARLSEAVFDNAVEKTEKGPCQNGCCCHKSDDDDDYYDEDDDCY